MIFFCILQANKYLENYERALHGFEAASLRDPGLNAESEAQKIVSLLEKIESSMKVTYFLCQDNYLILANFFLWSLKKS